MAAEQGQAIGGILGAAAGSIVPGVGTALGGAIGTGVGGLIGGSIDKKKSEQLTPGMVDPNEVARLSELNRLRKNISTGTDAITQGNIEQIKKLGATTQGKIASVTGGDVGGTVSGLLRAQKNVQSGVTGAVAQGAQRLPFFENLAQQLGTRVSQRKLELGLLKRKEAQAEGKQGLSSGLSNLMAVAATQGTMPGEGFNIADIFKNKTLGTNVPTETTQTTMADTPAASTGEAGLPAAPTIEVPGQTSNQNLSGALGSIFQSNPLMAQQMTNPQTMQGLTSILTGM